MHGIYSAFLMCALAVSTPTAFAQSNKVVFNFEMNWKGLDKQRDAAEKLQNDGVLPIPMVYVDKALVGLYPNAFPVEVSSEGFVIDIGVSQIADRPLYKIAGRREGELVAVSFDIAQIGISGEYFSLTSEQGILTLSGIFSGKSMLKSTAGAYELSLGASSYSALVDLAQRDQKRFQYNKIATVVQISDGKRFEPIAVSLIKQGGGKIFEGAYLDASWVNSVSYFMSPFRAPPPDRLKIESNPSRAEVSVNGIKRPQRTDAEYYIGKDDWGRTIVSKDKYRDCVVDPTKVDSTTAIPRYKCDFKKPR